MLDGQEYGGSSSKPMASDVSYNQTNVADELTVINGAIASLSDELDECFQSVSDGKSLVASAITDKGINTTADATFETMANNIANIQAVKTTAPKITIPNDTNYPSFSATVGKTYVVTIVAPGTANNSSL